ncbi:unnamed protein product, partial [Urochloa humidicola]
RQRCPTSRSPPGNVDPSPRTRRREEAQPHARYSPPAEVTQASSDHGQSKEVPDELPLGESARWRARASSHHSATEEAPAELRSRWICTAAAPTSSAHDRSTRRQAASGSCNNGAGDDSDQRRPQRIRAAAGMYGLILLSPSRSLRRPSHPGAAGRAARPSSKSGGAVGWLVWRVI